jgi:hypothetical protein
MTFSGVTFTNLGDLTKSANFISTVLCKELYTRTYTK